MASFDPARIPSATGRYQWDLYAAGTGPGGTGTTGPSGYARIYPQGWAFQSLPEVKVATPAAGLQKISLRLEAPPADWDRTASREYYLHDPADLTLFYSRVAGDGARGATVSSWGYGGFSTRGFLQDQWGAMSQAGRRAWLGALVDGGSGKLNVVIAEGLNDRNDRAVSADGVNRSDTPAGFRANVLALIGAIRAEWSAAGHAGDDLSFTLVGMYRDSFEPDDRTGPLWRFAEVEAAIAAADPQVSFVDLWEKAPAFADAQARGYMADLGHPSLLGAQVYSRYVVDAIMVPEPGALGAIGGGAVLLLGRRRRR